MSQPFVGQIIATGFNFAPVGWALCNGQLLAIAEYEALFTLIGTTYGGNGTTNFAVPDLRGRAAVGMGTGLGLSTYAIGQVGGNENVSLLTAQMPSHTHNPRADPASGTVAVPGPTVVLASPANGSKMYAAVTSPTSLEPTSIGPTTGAGSQPHENRQPLLAINYIIAQFGIFPSQG